MKLINPLIFLVGAALFAGAQPPPTPLFQEVLRNDTKAAKDWLEKGADPNEGRLAGFSAIFFTVGYQNIELFRAMVAKGADLQARDGLGGTLLMWAAYDDAGRTEMLEELLRLGMDPHAKNSLGETAWTWAERRGHTRILDVLRKAGASESEQIQAAVRNAIAVLQPSGPQFVKVSGCASCHHQSLPQMAFGVARSRGFAADESIGQQQVNAVIAAYKPAQEAMEQGKEVNPDPEVGVSYALLGLAAEAYQPDRTTAAMAHLISTRQRADGSFRTLPFRPPIESSDFTATALSLRALQLYGEAPKEQVQRAAAWLEGTAPENTEDRAMQLLGLSWAGTAADRYGQFAMELLAQQRPDGGWAQLANLETDAYATGQALVALHRAGILSTSDAAFQRGIGYLLRTQLSDGSWLVRTRSYPVQKLKESGFPNGRNQWISAAGTSWAAMALSLSLPLSTNADSPWFR